MQVFKTVTFSINLRKLFNQDICFSGIIFFIVTLERFPFSRMLTNQEEKYSDYAYIFMEYFW